MLLLIQFCNRSREGANQIADEKCENSLQIKGIQRIPSGISAVPAEEPGGALRAVSYTHLTLPTIYSVEISVDAAPLKKKQNKKKKKGETFKR